MSVEVIAGPYELFNLNNKKEKITIAIVNNNELSWRKYKGSQVIERNLSQCVNLEQAMAELEDKIKDFKCKKFFDQEDLEKEKEKNKKEKDEKAMIGKRKRELSPANQQ